MEISIECMGCLINKGIHQLSEHHDGRERCCMDEILKMMGSLEPGVSAPLAVCRMEAIIRRYYPADDVYGQIKQQYNRMMLELLPEFRKHIRQAKDPLAAALQYAMMGNYIDFGAMNAVDENKLQDLLAAAEAVELSAEELKHFRREIMQAKRVAYLHDNCGEIVLDTLLIDEIRALSGAEVISIVRGEPVLNDATVEDAQMCGLDAIGNGTAIAGTELSLINDEARRTILESSLVISKGQGNFETLYGHGLNIYYLFLCKCDYFTRRFGLERYKGVFCQEKRIAERMKTNKATG